MSDDLVTWLRAQLDEDERAARAVEGIRQPWYFEMIDDAAHPLVDLALDPARVLAEVDAKRRILDEHDIEYPGEPFQYCRVCHDRSSHDATAAPCRTLRLLAMPYADRPGYRDEWKP